MNRLSIRTWRAGALGAAIVALAALSSCNESPPAPPPPPPAAAYEPPPPPPALLGAPPQRDFVAMAPIPNPEDMTPAERIRVYGAGYAAHHTGHRAPGWWLRLHASDHADAAPPKVVPAKIVAAPTPVPIAAPPSALSRLAAAVSAKAKGAILAVPADLSAAKPGAVTLSLPADLFAVIRQEAAKLGLGGAARKTDVTATLHGDGYAITPKGPQTAHLTAGKPTLFTWQVQPGPKAKGPLTADVGALLKGVGDAKAFALTELKQAVAAAAPVVKQARAKAHQFKLFGIDLLTITGHKDVTLPVVGKTPYKIVVGAVIGLILLFILAMAMLGSIRRRETNQVLFYRTPTGEPVIATPRALDEPRVEPVGVTPMADAPALQPAVAAQGIEAAQAEPVLADHALAEPAHIVPALLEPLVADIAETNVVAADPFGAPAAAHPVGPEHQAEAVTAQPSAVETMAPEPVASLPAGHGPAAEPVLADPSLAEAPAAVEPGLAQPAAMDYPVSVEHAVAEQHPVSVEYPVVTAAPLADHSPSVVGLQPAQAVAAEPEIVYVEDHAVAVDPAVEPASAADHRPTETAFDHHQLVLESV